MSKEQLEKASKEYSKCIIDSFGLDGVPNGISAIKGMIYDGFVDGAEYRINSAWHTTADMPKKEELCLVEYKDSDGGNKVRVDWRSEYEWVGMCHYDTILRWAYISDLLPEGGAQ